MKWEVGDISEAGANAVVVFVADSAGPNVYGVPDGNAKSDWPMYFEL